jgi:hypothetical protein
MAVGYRNITTLGFTDSTTTVAVTKPSGTASGDLLLCMILCDDFARDFQVSPGVAGWTTIGQTPGAQFNGAGMITAFFKVAGGSEPASYSFNKAADSGTIVTMMALTGADQTSPVTGWSVADGTASPSTSQTANAVTGVTGDMAVAGWTCPAQAAGAAYTPPASMIERADLNDAFPWQLGAVATQALVADGSTGTLTATLTGATAKPWYGVSLLVRAPSAVTVKPGAFMSFFE